MVTEPNDKLMTPEEYIALYEKYMVGNCSPEEEAQLFTYQDQFLPQEPSKALSAREREARLRGYAELKERISRPVRHIRVRMWWAAAAALLIFSMAGIFLFRKQNSKPELELANVAPILPGKPMAILTLGNGKRIQLDKVANGLLAEAAGSRITKTRNGEIVYESSAAQNPSSEHAENTITVPAGGEYQLTLPDGTKVWINSATRLSYPVNFIGTERKVSLVGEAYFEVAKNKKMPFIVQAGETKTEVLGTHFNVMAYENEPQVKTTLLEGSVRFSSGSAQALIKPGQQGTAMVGVDRVRVEPADTDEAMAWKNGYFVFKHENVKSLMRRIARWYDIEVSFEGDVENKVFGGTFSKKKNLSELLTSLEQIGTVHFKTKGRRVTVMP